MRIGLLGGSFNPAHAAHIEISLTALKRLGLDQVWWMVTPGNPLKDPSKLPSLASASRPRETCANHPRIAVTGFAGEKGSAYTVDLLTELKRRFPGVNFVWLMGADNLAQFHRWRSWQKIFAAVPIAVLDRPGFRLKARASQAGTRFQELPCRRIGCPRTGAARRLRPGRSSPTRLSRPLLDRTARRDRRGEVQRDKARARKSAKQY